MFAVDPVILAISHGLSPSHAVSKRISRCLAGSFCRHACILSVSPSSVVSGR